LEQPPTLHPPRDVTGTGRPSSASGRLFLLAPPPKTRTSRAAAAFNDRWNALRNDLRLTVEHHMIAAPAVALAAGVLTGRILNAVFSRPRKVTELKDL